MPTCQYCGRTVGNEGALAQHERSCDENPADAPEPRRDRAPARREPRDLQPRGGGGAGAAVADTLYVLTNFDEMPSDVRRDAVQQGAGVAGGIINRWLDLREASMQRNRQRATQAELEPVEEYPVCPECDYQFGPDDLTGDEVRCPGCTRLYEVQLRDTAEQPA